MRASEESDATADRAVAPEAAANLEDLAVQRADVPEPTYARALNRAYLGARVVFLSVMVAMYLVGVFDFPGARGGFLRTLFVSGLIVASLVTGGIAAARFRVPVPLERLLWWALPFDLVGAGMLIWSLGGQQEDPIYPWVLGISIGAAAIMHRHDAWIVSGLATVTYLLAHFLGHATIHDTATFALLALKGAAIVFTGVVVSSASARQTDREAELISSQVEVRDLYERLSRRLNELRAVSEITEIIHSTLDFDRVGPLVLDILTKVIDVPASALFVIDKDKDETLFSASSGIASTDAMGLTDSFLRGGRGSDDAFACTAVLDHKRLMVVFCGPGDRIDRMSPEDRMVLQAVSNELVVAVENSQLYKLTKRLSITDELTGLFNYRYLQQRLDEEIERGRRYGRSLSLLMLDLDDFKNVNDTHGHVAGDGVLAEVGEILRAAVREIDVACRYGGEEFAVLLPEADAEGAFVVAEKLRESVALHEFADGDGRRVVHLTVSIGVATFPVAAADREELLRQADGALYQAKSTGRDRVRASSGGITGSEQAVREGDES